MCSLNIWFCCLSIMTMMIATTIDGNNGQILDYKTGNIKQDWRVNKDSMIGNCMIENDDTRTYTHTHTSYTVTNTPNTGNSYNSYVAAMVAALAAFDRPLSNPSTIRCIFFNSWIDSLLDEPFLSATFSLVPNVIGDVGCEIPLCGLLHRLSCPLECDWAGDVHSDEAPLEHLNFLTSLKPSSPVSLFGLINDLSVSFDPLPCLPDEP